MSVTVNNLSKIYGAQKAANNIPFILNKWKVEGLFAAVSFGKSSIAKKIFFLAISLSFCTAIFAQNGKPSFNTDSFIRKLDSTDQALIGKPYPDFKHLGDDGIVYSNKKMLGKK